MLEQLDRTAPPPGGLAGGNASLGGGADTPAAAAVAQGLAVRRAPRGAGRLAALDGLRLVAALMVVAYHYVGIGRAWDNPAPQVFPHLYLPASYGWLGVYLFFLISGFVICMSSMGRGLGGFVTARVVRLYPAYWFAVLATSAVLTLWPNVRQPRSPKDILVNLTMLQEPLGAPSVDAVYWTLWVELRFYLLFAIVVFLGATYRRIVLFCALWIVVGLFALTVNNELLLIVTMPDDAPFFVAGIAFFLMHRHGQTLVLWGIVSLSFLLAQHRLIDLHHHAEKVMRRDVPVLPTLILLCVFFALVGAVALGWLTVGWKWLTVAGALTYPLYLLHEYIGWSVIDGFQDEFPAGVLVAGLIAAMMGLAWLIHRLVERPVAPVLRRGLRHGMAALNSEGRR